MNEKDLSELIQELVPFVVKKLKQDDTFKNTAKITQAKVISINNDIATVQLPFDSNTFSAKIKTVDTITVGDNVFLLYWGDLKNAHIVFKN
ncbi:hypothetical protein [Congzhengia minquanensis]|uniref:Uncharacterized protein n=1 Tax=Congzhengia minquanensis TaxID=2763657 RepID=A0A926HZI1_9FIRM|nr:hypothetical protein [Congzhengia minquanensis]MBC8540876.1 hypothetical protein [Congzhengia minquanensis]